MGSIEIHGTKITREPEKKRSIVMLSGGIDSVFVLVKLLRETDDIVLSHHIHLVDQSGRHQVEAIRCRKIMAYCRENYRNFEYSESAIDHRGLFRTGSDMVTAAFEAGIVSRSYTAKFERPTDRWIFGSCKEKKNFSESHSHIQKTFTASCFPYPAPKIFRFPEISRIDQLRYLPMSLVELCWSCKNPVRTKEKNFVECGSCSRCEVRAKAGQQLAAKAVDRSTKLECEDSRVWGSLEEI